MTGARERARQAVRRFATDAEIAQESGVRDGEIVLVLPGEKKLKTVCSVLVGERDLRLTAFVIRKPDENHAQFYRWLLQRNLRTPGLAYALDARGDVFVVGRLPLGAVDSDSLDQLLGVVLESCDGAFNELLALGFLTAMRREWDWRVSRGESLRNLDAFRDILAGAEEPTASAAGDGVDSSRTN
ncbi:MAG: YbjN domain-containing protein [Dermatophilaceae bacterium]